MSCPKCPKCGSWSVVRAGFTKTLQCLAGQRRQRFRCQDCSRRFVSNAGSLCYYLKKTDRALNFWIFEFVQSGLSNRMIARLLGLSEHCVRLRIRRMAQMALTFHAEMVKDLKIKEALCMDGLENFAGSQYEPNNIQQALGEKSLFIYDFNFASLNRKGRMSDWQKARLVEIEEAQGRFNPKAIRLATRTLIKRLYKMRDDTREFTLLTDEHFQYRRAIKRDLKNLKIRHETVNSKECRNFQNILFPVNHADLMIRHQVKAFTRETIAFNKTAGAMCQRFALFGVHKNYMVPQFTKRHVRRPEAHEKSPAQMLGLTDRILGFQDVFYRGSSAADLALLNPDHRCFWRGEIPKAQRRSPKFRKQKLKKATMKAASKHAS